MSRLPSAAHFKSNSTLSSSSHSLVTAVVALSPVVAIGNDRPTGLDRLLLLSAHDHGSDAGERVDWMDRWMDGLSDEVILIGPGETR